MLKVWIIFKSPADNKKFVDSKNKKYHVVVEPDNSVIKGLRNNILNNSMKCILFNGFINKNNQCFT